MKTSLNNSSSYSKYTLTEIDNIIENFNKKFPPFSDEEYQTILNYKLLQIIRDLLIRIEKLEEPKQDYRKKYCECHYPVKIEEMSVTDSEGIYDLCKYCNLPIKYR